MADAQSAREPAADHSYRWLTTLISLMVGAAFFGLWFWLLPSWLGFSVEMAGAAGGFRVGGSSKSTSCFCAPGWAGPDAWADA